MNPSRRFAPALVFIGTMLAVGVPYGLVPLQQSSLPRDVWGPGLLVGALLAAAACAFARTRPWAAGLAVAAAVPAAVMARVVHDTLRDPTTHNLWPFELVLAAGPGILAGLGGALAGTVLARWRA